MSLFESAFEPSCIMDKKSIPDGRGGASTTYVEGAMIDVAYSFDTSTQARIAEQAGTTNRFTLTTRRSVVLQFHDVIKRLKDGQIFRVTSDGNDNEPPETSSLDMRQVEAEKWSLPNG